MNLDAVVSAFSRRENMKFSINLNLLGLIQVILIGLKIFSVGLVATWSWSMVLIPLWISLALFVLMLLFGFAFTIAASMYRRK